MADQSPPITLAHVTDLSAFDRRAPAGGFRSSGAAKQGNANRVNLPISSVIFMVYIHSLIILS